MKLYLAQKALSPAQSRLAMLHATDSRSLAAFAATSSERQGRAIDKGQSASMEDKKQEGYF